MFFPTRGLRGDRAHASRQICASKAISVVQNNATIHILISYVHGLISAFVNRVRGNLEVPLGHAPDDIDGAFADRRDAMGVKTGSLEPPERKLPIKQPQQLRPLVNDALVIHALRMGVHRPNGYPQLFRDKAGGVSAHKVPEHLRLAL